MKKFSRLMPSRQATSPFNFLCCSSIVCTTIHLCLNGREYWKVKLPAYKASILKIFSQNILFLCMEQYFWEYGVIRKYGTPYCPLTLLKTSNHTKDLICHLSTVNRHLSSVICHLPSAICHVQSPNNISELSSCFAQ